MLCIQELPTVSVKRQQSSAPRSQTGKKKSFATIAKLELLQLHNKTTTTPPQTFKIAPARMPIVPSHSNTSRDKQILPRSTTPKRSYGTGNRPKTLHATRSTRNLSSPNGGEKWTGRMHPWNQSTPRTDNDRLPEGVEGLSASEPAATLVGGAGGLLVGACLATPGPPEPAFPDVLPGIVPFKSEFCCNPPICECWFVSAPWRTTAATIQNNVSWCVSLQLLRPCMCIPILNRPDCMVYCQSCQDTHTRIRNRCMDKV